MILGSKIYKSLLLGLTLVTGVAIANPQDTIIAWDIDQVLLMDREENFGAYHQLHPDFYAAIKQVKTDYNLYDAFPIMQKLLEVYPQYADQVKEYIPLFTSAPQILGTIELVKKLHALGYSMLVASNMTSTTYQALVENGTLPNCYFSKEIFFTATNELNAKHDETGKLTGYCQKPNTEYFEHLKTYIANKFPDKQFKRIIFIDDKLENVQGAAQVAGIEAIQFINPAQLATELQAKGLW